MGWRSSTRERGTGSGQALSRRKIFKGGAVVAAVGAGAGALVTASGRSAAAVAQSTITATGAVAPTVVNLTDGATIAVDASLGNDFRVTIAGNRTMGNPANPSNGQEVIVQVTQGAGGSFTLNWGTGYEFSAELPQPVLSTAAGQTDLIGFAYNAARGAWLLVAFVRGFD